MELRPFAEWLDARQVRRLGDVTAADLDLYRAHITALSASGRSKADYLHAVRALWAYREHLPIECRLPPSPPWGSATARNLAGNTEWNRYNKTPRIHPDTMEALLAWALRVLEDFGPDIRDAFREDRQLMDGSHPTAQFYRERYFSRRWSNAWNSFSRKCAKLAGRFPANAARTAPSRSRAVIYRGCSAATPRTSISRLPRSREWRPSTG
jgi:hypothetical protein